MAAQRAIAGKSGVAQTALERWDNKMLKSILAGRAGLANVGCIRSRLKKHNGHEDLMPLQGLFNDKLAILFRHKLVLAGLFKGQFRRGSGQFKIRQNKPDPGQLLTSGRLQRQCCEQRLGSGNQYASQITQTGSDKQAVHTGSAHSDADVKVRDRFLKTHLASPATHNFHVRSIKNRDVASVRHYNMSVKQKTRFAQRGLK